MAQSNVIKEFLVALGFKTDESGMKKFVDGVETASKSVIKLGAVIETTALAVAIGVAKWASNLEQLYYSSRRVGDTVDHMQAFALASRNFGSSMEDAYSSLENIAAFMRQNPGGQSLIEGWLNRVGLSARGANGEMLQGAGLAAQLGKMFKIYRDNGLTFLASQQASRLGISDHQMLAMSTPGFAEELAAQEKRTKGWQKVTEAARRFMIQLEDLKMSFLQMMLGFEGPAMSALEGAMTKISVFMRHHGKQIITDLGEAFKFVIEGLGHLLDWLDKHAKEIMARLSVIWLDINFDFEIYVKPVFEWLWTQFLKLDKATDGWAAKVLLLSAALKALGATGIVSGIASLAAGVAKAATGLVVAGAAEGAGAWAIAGAAFGVAAWGAIGYGLGTLIYKILPEAAQRWIGDKVGHTVDWVKDMLDPKKQAAYDADPKNWYASHMPWDKPPAGTGAATTTVNTTVNVHGSVTDDKVKQIADGVAGAVRRAALEAAIKREFLATVR